MTLWTFYWNYRLFGENPLSYHCFSLILHGLVTVMIFLVFSGQFRNRFLAFSTALIFCLHPLQTQAVNYIWSRSVLLMAFFGLVSMLMVKKHPLIALCLFQLAIWSRTEALVLLPLLVIFNRAEWKRFAALSLINLLGFIYSLARYAPQELGWNYPRPVDYWMAQPVVFWQYLRLMIWPAGLNLDHDFNVPGMAAILLSALGLVALCAVAFRRRREHPVFAFGVFWLLCLFAPSWVMPNSDLFNESRAYLAMAGVALIACQGLTYLPRKQLLLLPIAALMALISLQRNELWKDDLALWQDAASKSPGKARVHYNLGAALTCRGDWAQAEREFTASRDLNPQDDLSYAGLAYCAERRKDWPRARRLYRQALRFNPGSAYAHEGLKRLQPSDPVTSRGAGLEMAL